MSPETFGVLLQSPLSHCTPDNFHRLLSASKCIPEMDRKVSRVFALPGALVPASHLAPRLPVLLAPPNHHPPPPPQPAGSFPVLCLADHQPSPNFPFCVILWTTAQSPPRLLSPTQSPFTAFFISCHSSS